MDAYPILREILADHAGQAGALLPILHKTQAVLGCVDSDAERTIAEALNVSRAEVHGVVSFYHDFSSSKDSRRQVQICRAEACQARGIECLMPFAEKAAGASVRLTTVYCLGLCSVGPNARVGDEVFARLDEAALIDLIERA